MRYKFGRISFWNLVSLVLIGSFVLLFGWLIKNDKNGNLYSKLTKYVEIPPANADAPGSSGSSGSGSAVCGSTSGAGSSGSCGSCGSCGC